MLIRNLNPAEGLCNGTKLICKALQRHTIDAEIVSGKHAGKRAFIPRITLTASDSGLPFDLRRRQFPIKLAFEMTINKVHHDRTSNLNRQRGSVGLRVTQF